MNNTKNNYLAVLGLGLIAIAVNTPVQADNHQRDNGPTPGMTAQANADGEIDRDLVDYPARFFQRFQPITALDLVNQVPGFQLDDDINGVRGFGGAAGNVLIDDRRPSAKQDTLSAILARIPADSVERIELIRGQVRSIDLRGQSAVVNLILKEGIPVAIQWEGAVRQTFGQGPLKPEAAISISDNWRGIDYNAGLDTRWSSVGRSGYENIFDGNRMLEQSRLDERGNRNLFIKANLNLAGWWGDTFVQVNSNMDYARRHLFTDSDRTNELTDATRNIFFDDLSKLPKYEFSLDLERNFIDSLEAKGILLYVTGVEDFTDTQVNTGESGNQTLDRLATGKLDSSEFIARIELDWTGFDNHVIQANAERAYNVLESALIQTDDSGAGPVVVNVPGANSRVEETRWDFLVKDTWVLGQLEFDYGLGAEASTIVQSGDTELDRDFFFLKPQGIMTYSWRSNDLSRIRLAREIAQLNLENFVSATEFVDNDIALGNPNIKPDATWKLELTHEKRFGGRGVVSVTVFHHWISDVLDLLPITDKLEAPGNIGDGRRWGLQLESTIPLGWMGLRTAKLDVKARWQDSTVVDPVTGENRVLSIQEPSAGPIVFDIENEYAFEIDYRQDFQAWQAAWGWSVWERGKQLRYKVNELEIYDEGTDVRAFIETTRWFGIKMRLQAEDLLDFADIRDRRIYAGRRGLSSLDSIQYRDRIRGVRLELRVSGTF